MTYFPAFPALRVHHAE